MGGLFIFFIKKVFPTSAPNGVIDRVKMWEKIKKRKVDYVMKYKVYLKKMYLILSYQNWGKEEL